MPQKIDLKLKALTPNPIPNPFNVTLMLSYNGFLCFLFAVLEIVWLQRGFSVIIMDDFLVAGVMVGFATDVNMIYAGRAISGILRIFCQNF